MKKILILFILLISSSVMFGQAVYPFDMQIKGDLTVGGALLPDVNCSYDIGSATKYWNNAYICGKLYTIGKLTIGEDANDTVTILGSFGLSNSDDVAADTIETALTDSDTRLPTSGAVYGAISVSVSQLEKITEGGNTGWRMLGRIAANYGDIGDQAKDLSYSNTASSVYGATGDYSFATGSNTTASGVNSYAEGVSTIAGGSNSHAEGGATRASGLTSHAEGSYTIASGLASHSQGEYTEASGEYSHAGGGGYECDTVVASGQVSFAHQQVTGGQGNKDAAGANSGIFAGKNNEISVAGIGTVILGGNGISATLPWTTYTEDIIANGSFKATTQINTVQSGSKAASFTHDAASGDIGAYALNTANAVTISIHNLSDGLQGTIFLNINALPSSVTINTYSDAGTTGLTEVILGSTPVMTASMSSSITYTCANDGTNTKVYLIYGQEY